MTEKAQSKTMLEIIEPLADPTANMVNLCRDFAADLALEMFPEERQPQLRVFSKPGRSDFAGSS